MMNSPGLAATPSPVCLLVPSIRLPDSTVTQTPLAMVKRFYRCAVRADWRVVTPLLHPDFEIIESPALPFSGHYQGLEDLKTLGRILVAN